MSGSRSTTALARGVKQERLGQLGYDGEVVDALFALWAGTENLEERVEGAEWIDPVVLDELRELTD